MSTPGQAAYEAFWASRPPVTGNATAYPADWDSERPAVHAQWEAAAQAVIDAVSAEPPAMQIAPCPAEGHDGDHFQVRTGAAWLCGQLLMQLLASQGIVPVKTTAWRLLDEARAELAAAREELDEMRAARDEYQRIAERHRRERDELRALLAEILATIEPWNSATSVLGWAVAAWRHRAGIAKPEAAITTSGTEHLAAELKDRS